MSRIYSVSFWLICVAITLWTFTYFVIHYSTLSFQEGALGNLFATILGLVVGIPIAIEINRRQQLYQAKIDIEKINSEESKRKEKILFLLRSELEMNLYNIKKCRVPFLEGGSRKVFTGGLKIEMWRAFSDGGELQFVNDPEVLAVLADAYHAIKVNIRLENIYLEVLHFPGMQFQQEEPPHKKILSYIIADDENLISVIAAAIMKLNTNT